MAMQVALRKLDGNFTYVMSKIALFAISNHFTFFLQIYNKTFEPLSF